MLIVTCCAVKKDKSVSMVFFFVCLFLFCFFFASDQRWELLLNSFGNWCNRKSSSPHFYALVVQEDTFRIIIY